MSNENNLELEWLKRINKLLIGKKIIKVQYLPKKDAQNFGWDKRPIQIKLDDNTWLTPTMDDEGNDGGALFTNDDDLPTIPVFND